jgi:hypothetical protein
MDMQQMLELLLANQKKVEANQEKMAANRKGEQEKMAADRISD